MGTQHGRLTSKLDSTGEPQIDYAEGAPPEALHASVTTKPEELWAQNERLFVWLLSQRTDALLRTVPGGGKSYVKETVVPQLAYETDRTFVLATTEYRNRQETYQSVLETVNDLNLTDLDIVYVPSPREKYGNIPRIERDSTGEWVVSTSDDCEAVCQTFTQNESGNHRYGVADEMDLFVAQGATTTSIHKASSSDWARHQRSPDYSQSPLICQQRGVEQGYNPSDQESEPACRYRRIMKRQMGQIENNDADIIICGASLLHVPEVVTGATVITDEDVSGELVENHTENYLKTATENFLSGIEVGPDTYQRAHRVGKTIKSNTATYIRENYAPHSERGEDDDREPLVNRNAPIKSESYDYDRAEAPLLTLALMEGEDTEETNHVVFNPDDIPYNVSIDLKRDNANNSHKPVAVANPPQALQEAEQVIALDATGSKPQWELLTGIEFESVSPNLREKRGTVISEAFDVEFRSLTKDMVPINNAKSFLSRKFLGILQAIVDHHDADEISIVTSKAMKRKVTESEYAEDVMALAYEDTILHFGGLRSDRTFEKSRLHVVIGAPHPGDDAVRQWMALLGYDDRIVQDNPAIQGENRFKGKAKTVLENLVHSEIYQAARRAARDTNRNETAFVYLFTRMFDKELIKADNTFTVDIFGSGEKRKGVMETILTVLDCADQPLKTSKIEQRVGDRLDGDPISYSRLTQKLNDLAVRGVIEEKPSFRNKKEWEMKGPPSQGKLVRKSE